MAYKRADFKLDETNDIDKRIEEAAKMFREIRSPTFETKIIKAIFLNQDIVFFPRREKVPNNITEVVRFLFGEGAEVIQDCVNNIACVRITGANYVLNDVRTINAEWEYKEVKDV